MHGTVVRRVLTRHDGGAGLVLGQHELADAAAWAGAEHADVVGHLHDGHGDGVERARHLHQRVVRRQRLELVRRSLERDTCARNHHTLTQTN